MEEEKIDPNYTKGFNLGYWLNKNPDGESAYKELLSMQTSEKFKETTLYQGLTAGRDEAFKERSSQKTDDDKKIFEQKFSDYREEGKIITQAGNHSPDNEKSDRSGNYSPEPPADRPQARQTGLSDKQLNELEDWQGKEQDRAARKEFKEGTRRINENTYENLQGHKIEQEAKQPKKEDEKESLINRFLNKGKKDKDKDRGRG